MKLTFKAKFSNLYFEAEMENRNEMGEVVDMINYLLGYEDKTQPSITTEPVKEPEVKNYPESNEPASDKQIEYMRKLGIDIPNKISKIQAINAINQYKKEHGIPWK